VIYASLHNNTRSGRLLNTQVTSKRSRVITLVHASHGEMVAVKAGETSLLEGLRDYETSMRAHGFEAVRNSLISMQALLGPRPVETA
jgi:hypothetical protein